MRLDQSDSRYVEHFESWGEFVEAANGPDSWPGPQSRNHHSATDHWAGGSLDDARRLARDGWPEGEAHVKRLSLALFDRLSGLIERPVYTYDVEGSDFDVARVVDGEPECWTRERTIIAEAPGRRIVRIAYCCAVSAGIDQDTMRARGAAVAALSELLEYAGYGVEITLTAGLVDLIGTVVPLKTADQPLDLPRVAYALIHPTTFRRLMFRSFERAPEAIRQRCGVTTHTGYGFPSDAPGAPESELNIGRARLGEPQWQNSGAARAWIVEQLKAQGVHLRETDGGEPEPAPAPAPYVPPYPRRRRRRW